jgi:hypothetical protein
MKNLAVFDGALQGFLGGDGHVFLFGQDLGELRNFYREMREINAKDAKRRKMNRGE